MYSVIYTATHLKQFLSHQTNSEYWGEMGFARVVMGKNMLGLEDHVAWVTPGEFTVQNVPCSEDGKECGGEEQNHGKKMRFVAQKYEDPSLKYMEKQTNLRVTK